MKNYSKQNIESLLDGMKPAALKEDLTFEQNLRRGLLNSAFFSDNPWFRWQRRLNLGAKTLVVTISSGSVIMGTILFSVIYPVNNINDSINHLANSAASAASQPQWVIPSAVAMNNSLKEALNKWYQDGKIQYDRQEKNGARVYLIKLDDNLGYVELRDPNPYNIRLISSP